MSIAVWVIITQPSSVAHYYACCSYAKPSLPMLVAWGSIPHILKIIWISRASISLFYLQCLVALDKYFRMYAVFWPVTVKFKSRFWFFCISFIFCFKISTNINSFINVCCLIFFLLPCERDSTSAPTVHGLGLTHSLQTLEDRDFGMRYDTWAMNIQH